MTSPAHHICMDCGLDHSHEARLLRLRRALPATALQLVARYPCLYRDVENGGASWRLLRDLKDIGAVIDAPCGVAGLDADWRLP